MLPTVGSAPLVRPLRIALIGNPNTGKSTLFNVLAGMRVRTGNYPGVTVEQKIGRAVWNGQAVELIDLPGTYSLSPRSPDEMLTVDVLTGCGTECPPDAVICICSAVALDRNLFLAMQVREVGLPTVVCLNMWDAVEKSGLSIDPAALSAELGLPVVVTLALQHSGMAALQEAVLGEISRNFAQRRSAIVSGLPLPVVTEVARLAEWLSAQGCPPEQRSAFLITRSLLDAQGSVEQMLTRVAGADYGAELQAARARLAEQSVVIPAVEATHYYARIGQMLTRAVAATRRPGRSITDRLDSVLTHRVFGFLICLAVMLWIFSTIYWFSQPLSEAVEAAMGWLVSLVTASMLPGAFRSLVVDGVIGGVGAVLVFLPQIAFLFLFIAVLEDSGYMARAAFMMDRLMAMAGLSGRSFLPLMSSFACAVPGIMATRIIEDRRDRFVTILIAPLMSCSARLPIYILMTGMFVPDTSIAGGWIPLRGVVLLAISLLGLVVAIPVACVLRRTFFRGEPSTFLMELPEYRWPSWRVVFHRVWSSSQAFVRQAGTLIFATTVIVWVQDRFPVPRLGDMS